MPVVMAMLVWPLVEIALFVTLGGWLGLWLTLVTVLGTGIAGVALMRWRGLRAMADVRGQVRQMANPLPLVADQAVFMLAAMLLILPGFLTDFLGLLLLIPPVRATLIAGLARRMPLPTAGVRRSSDVIDAEFTEIEAPRPQNQGPSGWTQD